MVWLLPRPPALCDDAENQATEDSDMERSDHEALSPAGQVDAWGDLAAGLRYNRAGRRRALRMLAALAVVVAAGTALILMLS